jgi:FAD/FMN-containing dehydrogenase
MTDARAYERRRDSVIRQFAAARTSGARLELRKSTSNLFRAREPRSVARLDVRRFTHVLGVDHERMVAEVEGMTTFETAVEETLRYGLLPTVCPQLKTITVGGAVSGLGIESSSFRYGLVHESVDEMEVLTGEGNVIRCSPSENADLFYGFPNSYGTLGYALRLKIRLMRARPFVKLTHRRFSRVDDYFSELACVCAGHPPDFVDGTVFGPDEMYLSTGEFVEAAPFTSDYTWMRIYYKSIRERQLDYLSTRDYIWRWDTDWFWCSKQFYAQQPAVRLLATKWMLNSRTWQRIMRFSQRLLPGSAGAESVIQDVDIPIENASDFLGFLLENIGITPIWICPFRSGCTSIYPLYKLNPGSLYVNFGFWDVIPGQHEPGYFNRAVERKALELEGKKALYSTSCYDRETFWSIYNQTCYSRLKERYDPSRAFPDLYEKCVERR